MLQMNFVSGIGKTAHTSVVTRKHVIMNRNKYIYNFWMTVFCFASRAVQLHMGMLATIICQRRSQLQKNKEILCISRRKREICSRKKARSCWVKQGCTVPHIFCVLTFLTLSNNNWASSSVQIRFISGYLFNFTLFFGGIFYQMCLTNVFSLCLYKMFWKNQK